MRSTMLSVGCGSVGSGEINLPLHPLLCAILYLARVIELHTTIAEC